jgi:hypothetical protein
MDSMLRDLNILFVYQDYILIASRRESLSHRCFPFERLNKRTLIVTPAKCQFKRLSIDFLGHHIPRDGATPMPSKVVAVAAFPQNCKTRAL